MEFEGADEAQQLQRRESERLRKRDQRDRKKRLTSLTPDKPKVAPPALKQKLGELKEAVAPLGPGEAARQLEHAARGAARILRSDVEFESHEFDDAGAAYADLSKVVWPLRLFIRALIPLILIGALWQIGAKILEGTPWWQRRREKKERERQEAKSGQLRVLQTPGGEPPPPAHPGINYRPKLPFGN